MSTPPWALTGHDTLLPAQHGSERQEGLAQRLLPDMFLYSYIEYIAPNSSAFRPCSANATSSRVCSALGAPCAGRRARRRRHGVVQQSTAFCHGWRADDAQQVCRLPRAICFCAPLPWLPSAAHPHSNRRRAIVVKASCPGAYVGIKSAGEPPMSLAKPLPLLPLWSVAAPLRSPLTACLMHVPHIRGGAEPVTPNAGQMQQLVQQKSAGFWQTASRQINVRRWVLLLSAEHHVLLHAYGTQPILRHPSQKRS